MVSVLGVRRERPVLVDGANLQNVPKVHFKPPESRGDRRTSATCLSVLRCAVAGVRRCSSSVLGTEGAVQQQRCRRSPEKKDLTRKKEKRQNGIPELPDGRLASKTTDSCFPLIYLQQEETVQKREREGERVGVLSRTQRGAPPPLRSSAQPVCYSELRDLHSLRRRTASVCVAADSAH